MPLNSPEDYERLSRHLNEIDPMIDDFCRRTGFSRQTTGISRYAMRRLVLNREVRWWIELRMLEDEHGNRYDSFFPEAPYHLGGGGFVDLNGYRYSSDPVATFERMPFHLLVPQLSAGLDKTWQRICNYTLDELVSLGPKVKLNLSPKIEIVPKDENKS